MQRRARRLERESILHYFPVHHVPEETLRHRATLGKTHGNRLGTIGISGPLAVRECRHAVIFEDRDVCSQ